MQMKEKEDLLKRQMEEWGIREEDLIEKFILGSGKGGQKINKTSSCVYLKHIPSGIEVKCQAERSRELNRQLARRELLKRIKKREEKLRLEQRQLREKVRRQKRRRTKGAQEEVLIAKKRHSSKKNLRRAPKENE